jgi:hypothetical protein
MFLMASGRRHTVVAQRGAEVLVSATSFGDRIDQSDSLGIDRTQTVIQYVDRVDALPLG